MDNFFVFKVGQKIKEGTVEELVVLFNRVYWRIRD